MSSSDDKILCFRRIVWWYYRAHGRHDLPWRPPSLKLWKGKEDDTLYHVLVSEVMLQQTQVERVIPFYRKFIKQFPTAKKLAAASLLRVLKVWQGLGYNRRAKLLREAAQKLVDTPLSGTRFNLVKNLEGLSGVGSYTARAIAAFAYNQDVIFVETNIRTAITHHFFAKKKKVSDAEIENILERTLPRGKAREWYSALMDYGAFLKKSGVRLNAKSKKYVKQSKFVGSLRQARGAILREYTKGITSRTRLINLFGSSRRAQMKTALKALVAEGLIPDGTTKRRYLKSFIRSVVATPVMAINPPVSMKKS